MRRQNPAAARYPVCRVLLVMVSLAVTALLLAIRKNSCKPSKAAGELIGLHARDPHAL